jgi:hypothetical protein
MNREEVLRQIEELLRQHKDGTRGSLDREPNKGDLFRLFAAAFNGGLIDSPSQSGNLRADVLVDTLTSRAPELTDHVSWHTLYSFWSAWTYAWQHVQLLNR